MKLAKGGKDLRPRRCVRSEWNAFESTGSRVKGPAKRGALLIAPGKYTVVWGRDIPVASGPGRKETAAGTGAGGGEYKMSLTNRWLVFGLSGGGIAPFAWLRPEDRWKVRVKEFVA